MMFLVGFAAGAAAAFGARRFARWALPRLLKSCLRRAAR